MGKVLELYFVLGMVFCFLFGIIIAFYFVSYFVLYLYCIFYCIGIAFFIIWAPGSQLTSTTTLTSIDGSQKAGTKWDKTKGLSIQNTSHSNGKETYTLLWYSKPLSTDVNPGPSPKVTNESLKASTTNA